MCSVISHGFALQIILTSWAVVSLAGGGLGNVEEKEERQAEKEKSPLSHPRQRDPQERNLGWTISMKDRKHVGAILIEITSRSRFWILDKNLCCRYLYLKFSHLLPNLCLQRKTLLCWSSNIPYILGNLRRVQNIPKDFHSCTNSFKWKKAAWYLIVFLAYLYFSIQDLILSQKHRLKVGHADQAEW